MSKRGLFFKDKRADEILFPVIIRIVVYVVFFGLLLLFVYNSSTGAVVYEQAYAKQIGLMIDKAEPASQITIDFSDGIVVAKENKITSRENLVSVKDNIVFVKLSNNGGYKFRYFSDYDVDSYFSDNNLIININEKK